MKQFGLNQWPIRFASTFVGKVKNIIFLSRQRRHSQKYFISLEDILHFT